MPRPARLSRESDYRARKSATDAVTGDRGRDVKVMKKGDFVMARGKVVALD